MSPFSSFRSPFFFSLYIFFLQVENFEIKFKEIDGEKQWQVNALKIERL